MTETHVARDSNETRAKIEEVALAMFLEHGYDSTPLHAIAEAVGMTTPALYWHYKSKAALCFAALAHDHRRFSELLLEAIGDADPPAQLRAYVRAFVHYQLDEERGSTTMGVDQLAAALPADQRSQIAEYDRKLLDAVRAVLRQGVEEGHFRIADPSVTALAINCMCVYVFTWYRREDSLTVADIAEMYAEFAVRMAGWVGSSSDVPSDKRGRSAT